MIFPAAEIHHLPRVKSDHCPILLIFDPLERKPPKPFCFEQMWLIDPFFLDLVAQSWDASENLPSASSSLCSFPRRLAFLTKQISVWNKTQFGNLFQRKNRLLARLRGLQVALARNQSPFLYSLEQRLIQDYNTILHQEYLFWQLKSCIMWLSYGDANTKYFHLQTIHWCSQSRVTTLKDETGLWLTGEPLVQHIMAAFTKLFKATSAHMRPSSRGRMHWLPNSPFLEHAQALTNIPQPAEIFRTLKNLPPLKAPGPDGYHALFFQIY